MSKRAKSTPTPEEMARCIIAATEETDRLLGSFTGGFRSVITDAAIVSGVMLDLLAALKQAEDMLLVSMHRDLDFCKKTREEIIAEHPGMKLIREAIAKAEGRLPEANEEAA